ncbi:MAG TPA: AMP-binding protein [Rhizomicrobium sp.]
MAPRTAQKPEKLHPFTGHDVPWLLRARAETTPDRTFLIFAPFDKPVERWSYARFYEAVEKLAAGLSARGIRKGDFLLLHMDNCIEFLLTWHASSLIGSTVVTTNTRSSLDELTYFVEHCGAKAAVTQPRYEALVRQAAPKLEFVAVTSHDTGTDAEIPRSAAAIAFEDIAEGERAKAPHRPPEPMLFNSVQYTSGTTSRPKGVVWTHANALWGARLNAGNCDLRPDDIGHTCLPLYHTNALCYSHLATLWAGATLVFQPRFSASRYWPVVVEQRCTFGVQIPFMLKALMGVPLPKQHHLTRWGLGALNPKLVMDTLGIPCIGWFGMTETIALPLITMHGLPGREMAMGLPAPEYGIQVRREDGGDVAFGESGLMWIKGIPGLSLFQEYLNNPEATDAAFDADGWFLTGDRVTAFEDGHIRFDGRERDMLRIGAENVAESEIERVVMGAGGIVEVAVVGKPHPMLDEVPVAFVLPLKPDAALADRVTALCKEKLADFKVPREVRVVEEFPRVTLGKIDKKELRRRLKEEAG